MKEIASSEYGVDHVVENADDLWRLKTAHGRQSARELGPQSYSYTEKNSADIPHVNAYNV